MELCKISEPDDGTLEKARLELASGRLVAFPTETVYGLGADAENEVAVAAIYTAKGRPSRNPLIVHLADMSLVERYAELTPEARMLAERFWPGPLTLVLKRKADCRASSLVSAGGETIALRVPRHPVAQRLLAGYGRGVAAPSANRSGRISPTQAAHVVEEFSGLSEGPSLILNGGATQIGIESTVLDCSGDMVSILRSGSVTEEEIRAVLSVKTYMAEDDGSTLLAPGMLASHYAPQAPVRLNITEVYPGEALLAFGVTTLTAEVMRNLSPSGNLEEAAHVLYACLRELDHLHPKTIAVMPIPENDIGVAINDRLRRAAANK